MKTRLFSYLEKIIKFITGCYHPVKEIPYGEDEIGYTSKEGSIYVSTSHKLITDLPKEKRNLMVMGVAAHETMHQVATNFNYHEKFLRSLPPIERKLFSPFFNILEDMAIEWLAHFYFEGKFLKALYFSICTLYNQANPLGEERDAYEELLVALIQFGDGGFIKGNFYNSEAKNMFAKILPKVDAFITEVDSKKRIDFAYEIFQDCKPLWEETAKDLEAMEKLAKLMSEMGKDNSCEGKGSGSSSEDISNSDGKSSSDNFEKEKSRRRKSTEKKTQDDTKKNANYEQASTSGGSEVNSGVANNDTSRNTETNSSSSDGKSDDKSEDADSKNSANVDEGEGDSDDTSSDNSDSKGTTDEKEENSNETNSSKTSEPSEPSESSEKSEKSEKSDEDDLDNGDTDSSDLSDDYIQYEISDEEIKAINAEINETPLNKKEITDYDRVVKDDESLSVIKDNEKNNHYSCQNNFVLPNKTDNSGYAYIVKQNQAIIKRLIAQFQRIIRNDYPTTIYKNSGHVDTKRLVKSKTTPKIFTKTRDGKHRNDVAVAIAVDESGSMMHCNRYQYARTTAIILAEVFAKIKYPIKIFGFSSNISGYNANHYHYVNWKNTKAERLSLLNIKARANNFDAYSIEFASQVLAKRPESHKILIVISDGMPSCDVSFGKRGITDTMLAVKSAKKLKQNVLGVAIGADKEVLQEIYKESFVNIKKLDSLALELPKEIKKIVKKW